MPAGALSGKIVFVGLTASGLLTHLATPISGRWGPTSDTLLHANVLSALLKGRAIRPADPHWLLAASLVPLAALLTGFLFLSPWRTLLLTFALGGLSMAFGTALLQFASVWVSPVPTLIALLVVYPLWSWRRLEMTMWRLQRELRRLADDGDILPGISMRPRDVRGDALERHIALVEQAADRLQDMKRFVWDCLNSLPEPILIADQVGTICIANKAAHAYFARVGSPPPESRSLMDALGEMTFIKTIGDEMVSDAELQARWPEVLDPTDFTRVWTVKRGIEVRDRTGRDYLLRYARCRNARRRGLGILVSRSCRGHPAAFGRTSARRCLAAVIARYAFATCVGAGAGRGRDEHHALGARAQALEHIERYTRRALTLADDFVQLTRAESQVYIFEPVNLADVVLDASDEIWPQARAKRIRVETQFDGDMHWIRADRSLMTRAITNLLNNAVKYSPADTVVQVSVASRESERIACRIVDQGYGMGEEARAHLFERFRRFRVPGQPPTHGTGLGMALVKTVVTRHEGDVKVESEAGRGTAVTVLLPRWAGAT